MSKKVYTETERKMRGFVLFYFYFILSFYFKNVKCNPFILKTLNAKDLQASMMCGGDLVAGFVDRQVVFLKSRMVSKTSTQIVF